MKIHIRPVRVSLSLPPVPNKICYLGSRMNQHTETCTYTLVLVYALIYTAEITTNNNNTIKKQATDKINDSVMFLPGVKTTS